MGTSPLVASRNLSQNSKNSNTMNHPIRSAVTFILLGFVAATRADDSLTTTQAALEKYVETKQLISKERQRSMEGEELLHARIDLLRTRVRDVTSRTDEIRKELAQTSDKRQSLVEESARLDEALGALEARVATLEAQTKALLRAAPEPLRRKAKVLSQQFPRDPDSTDLSLSVRYQNLIGVLNMMNGFNNEVTLSTEVRQIGTGKAMEVRVLYFGLAQAYFCNKDASVAGIGLPGPDGWQWQRRDDIGPAVASLIAQNLNEETPAYRAVPVTIVDLGAQHQ